MTFPYLPWWNAIYAPDTISQQTTNQTTNNISHKPCTLSNGLLGSLIPHRYNKTHRRSDTRLNEPQEEARGPQPIGTFAQDSQHENSRPDSPVFFHEYISLMLWFEESIHSHSCRHEAANRQTNNQQSHNP